MFLRFSESNHEEESVEVRYAPGEMQSSHDIKREIDRLTQLKHDEMLNKAGQFDGETLQKELKRKVELNVVDVLR